MITIHSDGRLAQTDKDIVVKLLSIDNILLIRLFEPTFHTQLHKALNEKIVIG